MYTCCLHACVNLNVHMCVSISLMFCVCIPDWCIHTCMHILIGPLCVHVRMRVCACVCICACLSVYRCYAVCIHEQKFAGVCKA